MRGRISIEDINLEHSKEIKENQEIRKKIYSMILPITGENILQMTAGFISMAMIGRIDKIAIGSLGLSTRITQILWAFFRGIVMGASVFVAQAYGAGDLKKLRKVVQQTLISSIILVIIFQVLVYAYAPYLLKVFGPGPELLNNAIIYLRVVSFGLPFMCIMLVVAGILQGMGNAKTPLRIAFIMNLFNIVFSYLFIFGKFNIPALGLKGAAIAIVMAQFIGAMLGLYVLFNRDGVLRSLFNKSLFKFDIKEIKEIYRVGLPSSMESIFWQLSAVILTTVILSFGETALASYQLGLQAESISYMPAQGFSVAATTFVGQCLGAREAKKGKKYLREATIGSMIVTSISVILFIFFPKSIMRLLTNDAEVIALGAKYLILMGLVQIPQNLSGLLNGALRGAGYTKVPMIVSGMGIWVIRIPISLILTYWLKMNIIAIWAVMCIDLVCRFILSYTIYKKKDIYSAKALI